MLVQSLHGVPHGADVALLLLHNGGLCGSDGGGRATVGYVDDLNVLHEFGIAEAQTAWCLRGMKGGKFHVSSGKRNGGVGNGR